MGPTILLDKSTLQSLGKRAIHELMRYFLITIPPTLLHEILADLEKTERKLRSSSEEVLVLASKLASLGGEAKVNVDFRWICLNELLGWTVPMDGVPIVAGARHVRTSDGRRGVYLPPQPEMDAVLRWASGEFSESDRALAAQWRSALNSYDPDSLRRSLPPLVKQAESLSEVNKDVELMLNDEDALQVLAPWWITVISPEPARDAVEEWTLRRWKSGNREPLAEFAPYSRHCLKVTLLFHLVFANRLVKMARSSWVDVEYLYYLPFAEVFSSGDHLHEKLAEFVLRKDQSFAPRDLLVRNLQLLADRRQQSKTAQESHGSRFINIDPKPGCCVHGLWVRHRGGFRPQSRARSIPEDERQRMMDNLRPIMEAMERDSKKVPQRVWPG